MPTDAVRSEFRGFEGDDHTRLSGEAPGFDPPEFGSPPDDELGDSPFALAFDSGGES